MDFRDSPDEAAFRDRLRSWLSVHAKEFPSSGDEYWARQGEWHRALYEGGFFGLSWPREYGGQELQPVYDVILDEELARAEAPPRPSLGYLVAGLSRHGSKELCTRFLPGMINGTERWCQGFSEPGSGSDLASLTTTATRDWRQLRHQRTQDLDQLLRCRGLVSAVGPHRSRAPSGTGAFQRSSSR